MLAVPIFHVNGEVPRDVAAVTQLAVAYPSAVSPRRGHRHVLLPQAWPQRGDEPSFTQPRMYEVIRSKPNPRQVYAEHLVRIGTLTAEECDEIYRASFAEMQAGADAADIPEASATERKLASEGVVQQPLSPMKGDLEPAQRGIGSR